MGNTGNPITWEARINSSDYGISHFSISSNLFFCILADIDQSFDWPLHHPSIVLIDSAHQNKPHQFDAYIYRLIHADSNKPVHTHTLRTTWWISIWKRKRIETAGYREERVRGAVKTHQTLFALYSLGWMVALRLFPTMYRHQLAGCTVSVLGKQRFFHIHSSFHDVHPSIH